jgi:hypothetical protein
LCAGRGRSVPFGFAFFGPSPRSSVLYGFAFFGPPPRKRVLFGRCLFCYAYSGSPFGWANWGRTDASAANSSSTICRVWARVSRAEVRGSICTAR